jgi:hypothetical protein
MYPRRQKSRFLRLTACTLAVVGLLGHGLAMLLLDVLIQSPAAARSGLPGYAEICSANGLATLTGNGSGEEGVPRDGGRHPADGKFQGCPVCNAFAQNGPADLPQSLQFAAPDRSAAAPRPGHQTAQTAPGVLLALSRGPPATA